MSCNTLSGRDVSIEILDTSGVVSTNIQLSAKHVGRSLLNFALNLASEDCSNDDLHLICALGEEELVEAFETDGVRVRDNGVERFVRLPCEIATIIKAGILLS